MGVYNNGTIFGIRIYNFNDDECSNILFEEKYVEVMSHEQMKEAYLFYTELNNKDGIHFQYYTECFSTYGEGTFLMWHPLLLDAFLEKFGI